MTSSWIQKLMQAIAKARAKIVGREEILNDEQAMVAVAVVEAYGDEPAAFIYFEPCTADNTERPPDVFVCHPDTGILVIEVKSFRIGAIEAIEAGSFRVRSSGNVVERNPFNQASRAMYDVKNAVERRLENFPWTPLTNFMVALPNITRNEWNARSFDQACPAERLLLQDELESPVQLKRVVSNLVERTLKASHKPSPLIPEHMPGIMEAFGDTAVINRKRTARTGVRDDTLGAVIDEMECAHKRLSSEQQELSDLPVGNFPRVIRGVAGSGKTVVLANMVAHFLRRRTDSEPPLLFSTQTTPPKIAVVCFNRALMPFIKEKITASYRQQTCTDPPWQLVTAAVLNQLMYELCLRNRKLTYIRVHQPEDPADLNRTRNVLVIEDQAERAKEYRRQLKALEAENPAELEALKYDAIFVDEGQDLVPEEFRLLVDLTRPSPVTGEPPIIIFYDDAQNLYGHRKPVWKEIGIDVAKGDRSRVMKQCFRNTREIVEFAFNVLLGSRADQQTRVATRQFADVYYLKSENLIDETDGWVKVKFAERSGPKPVVRSFSTRQQELDWVASETIRLVESEHIRPEDILIVFNMRDLYGQTVEAIRRSQTRGLIREFIPAHEDAYRDRYIFQEGCLTATTTFSAKGYDAPVVFLIGTDLFKRTNEGRASFYVGATRAKFLLYVTGIHRTDSLMPEVLEVSKALS